MDRKMRVAAVQMGAGQDMEENLGRAALLVEEAVSRGADFVVLPENFAFMGPDDAKVPHGERIGDAQGPAHPHQ